MRREGKRSWGNLLNWLFNEEQYRLSSKEVGGAMRRESEKHGVFTELELQEKTHRQKTMGEIQVDPGTVRASN